MQLGYASAILVAEKFSGTRGNSELPEIAVQGDEIVVI